MEKWIGMPRYDGRIEVREDKRILKALSDLTNEKGTDVSAVAREGMRQYLKRYNRLPKLVLLALAAGTATWATAAVVERVASTLGLGLGNGTGAQWETYGGLGPMFGLVVLFAALLPLVAMTAWQAVRLVARLAAAIRVRRLTRTG